MIPLSWMQSSRSLKFQWPLDFRLSDLSMKLPHRAMMQIVMQTSRSNRILVSSWKLLCAHIYSLGDELWMTANMLLPPLFNLLWPLVGLMTASSWTHYLSAHHLLCAPSFGWKRRGLSQLKEEERMGRVSVQVTLPEESTHTVPPPPCCIMDEGQAQGERGKWMQGPYYLVIHF